MAEIKSISPLVSQIVLMKLGMFCAERLNVDIYFLMEAVDMLIADVGEDFLKKKYEERGQKWEDVEKNLKRIRKLVYETKVYYDGLEDKKFDKKDKENIIKKYFIRTSSKLALMQPELWNLFVILVKNATIQRNSIPNDAFKILEHSGFRKIELNKTKQTTQTQNPQVVVEQE